MYPHPAQQFKKWGKGGNKMNSMLRNYHQQRDTSVSLK
jgi:hypothetical protein